MKNPTNEVLVENLIRIFCRPVFKVSLSSLCWLTKGKQLRQGIIVLAQLYFRIHINISATYFGPYGHRQVGYSIRGRNYII